MAKIKHILAREILDSKGNPTIETTVELDDGAIGVASCPSGTSVGGYEALELRDNDVNRYQGLGVLKAIENVKSIIAPKLLGMDATKQQEIDKAMIELDGTQNKGKLGANATLSVSVAVAKAAAKSSILPLFLYLRQFLRHSNQNGQEQSGIKIPAPLFNLINGGKHADNTLDFQEFLVIPATSKQYSEALYMSVVIYNSIRRKIKQNNLSTLIGDEGGFAPNISTNKDALSLIKQAVDETSYKFGFDVFLGIDTAANSFYKDAHYLLKDRNIPFSAKELSAHYQELNKTYQLLYLEDPFFEDDWESWSAISTQIGGDTIIVADDLTATNPYRLQMAINKKAATGIIIKPNQIGTVIETMAVVEVARASGLKIIVSHRSGETNDDFIADFAVAVSSDYVKFGAPVRGERVAKYNRLLEIEAKLKNL